MSDNEITNNNSNNQTSEINVDALLSNIESTGDAHTSVEPAPAKEATTQPATQVAQPEIDFTWNGKQIKVPANDPRIKQWASQGYDYAQKMSLFQQQQQALKEIESKYKPIDDYVRQNPTFWDHVTQSWEQKQQMLTGDPTNPVVQELTGLKQKLTEIEQFKQSIEQERQAQHRQAEDKQLNEDMELIKKEYPDLDLNAVDAASGKTLEYRVLEFAVNNGLKNFKHAFNLFNHENLIKRAEERGKEAVTKDIQKKTRLGLLGKSSTPTKGLQDAENVKNKTYDQLLREAQAELLGA